jgi:predicted lysophospholipase L1 biosynthesis ABC-type transport system permease subunit
VRKVLRKVENDSYRTGLFIVFLEDILKGADPKLVSTTYLKDDVEEYLEKF